MPPHRGQGVPQTAAGLRLALKYYKHPEIFMVFGIGENIKDFCLPIKTG
jgi:hypothetical protein